MAPDFGTKKHWDEEYKDPDGDPHYDWLMTFDDVEPIIREALPSDAKENGTILHLGSGNSTFPERMWELGYKHQISTDISEVCCRNMRERYQKMGIPSKELFFCAADCTDLQTGIELKTFVGEQDVTMQNSDQFVEFVDRCYSSVMEMPDKILDGAEDVLSKIGLSTAESTTTLNQLLFREDLYDIVMEKSCLDALFCFDGDHAKNIMNYLKEAHTVMKPSIGVFLMVSMHKPYEVERYLRLKCFGWQVRHVKVLDKPKTPMSGEESIERTDFATSATSNVVPRRQNYHYVYICTELDKSVLSKHWDEVYAEVMKEPDADPPKWLMVPEE